MKHNTWMPLYVGDYLKDTMGLSRAEHGSYMLLIMAYWANGGAIKDDDRLLQMICRCPPAEWVRTRGLLAQFFEVENGMWVHKRIELELGRAARIEHDRSEAGKLGAKARWQTDSKRHGKHEAEAVAEPMAKTMQPQWQNDGPSPSQSHVHKERVRMKRPSIEEMLLHGEKIGLPREEVEKCHAYYESNGWRVGRNPMKSWQSAMIHWRSNWQSSRHTPSRSRAAPESEPWQVVEARRLAAAP